MFASKSFSRSLVAVCALGLGLAACDSSSPDAITDTPPALISSNAFEFDDESFASTSAQQGQGTSSVHGPHHSRAYLTVVLVDLAIGVHLIAPFKATGSAGQDTPHVENGTWIWENTTTIFNSVVDVRLEGTPSGSQVAWEMYITSDNLLGQTYDNFILYSATTQIGGQMSSWSLYYNIAGQGRTRVLDADYEQTGAQHELTFRIPDTNPNQGTHGASVDYMADGNVREFNYQEPTPDQNHFIEWDAVTAAGSITAWDYNGGVQACWDSNLDDTPCVPTL